MSAPIQYNWCEGHPYEGNTKFRGVSSVDDIDLDFPVWLYDHNDRVWRYVPSRPVWVTDWNRYFARDRSMTVLVDSRMSMELRELDRRGAREVVVGELQRLAYSTASLRHGVKRLVDSGGHAELVEAAEEAMRENITAISALLCRNFGMIDSARAHEAATALVDAETVQQGANAVIHFDEHLIATLREVDGAVSVEQYSTEGASVSDLGSGVCVWTASSHADRIEQLIHQVGGEPIVSAPEAGSAGTVTIMYVRDATLGDATDA